MMKKDLLCINDLSPSEIEAIFKLAEELKAKRQAGIYETPLQGKTLAIIFNKPSTRSRISFEVGMYQLGGQAIFLNSRDIQLGRGESLADTARVLSRYVEGLLIRTFHQAEVEELAKEAAIPVINGLTDLLHPCQILSDMFTLKEKRGSLAGLKIAYIGDGNNMANSWMWGAAKTGLELALGTPPDYAPDADILSAATHEAEKNGGRIELFSDIYQAVRDADAIYTDVWASMGQEEETKQRLSDFAGYQVDQQLLRSAAQQVLIMHCLPAHRGEEITAEVLDGPHSIIFDQVENRLHINKAILMHYLG